MGPFIRLAPKTNLNILVSQGILVRFILHTINNTDSDLTLTVSGIIHNLPKFMPRVFTTGELLKTYESTRSYTYLM